VEEDGIVGSLERRVHAGQKTRKEAVSRGRVQNAGGVQKTHIHGTSNDQSNPDRDDKPGNWPKELCGKVLEWTL
jgi:hypothetical protein